MDWTPLIVNITSFVVMTALSLGVYYFYRWTGIRIEDKHMNSLHSAIMTGVAASLARHGTHVTDPSNYNVPGVKEAVTTEAINYARRSVPDAINALHPTDGVLKELALSKLQMLEAKRGL